MPFVALSLSLSLSLSFSGSLSLLFFLSKVDERGGGTSLCSAALAFVCSHAAVSRSSRPLCMLPSTQMTTLWRTSRRSALQPPGSVI